MCMFDHVNQTDAAAVSVDIRLGFGALDRCQGACRRGARGISQEALCIQGW